MRPVATVSCVANKAKCNLTLYFAKRMQLHRQWTGRRYLCVQIEIDRAIFPIMRRCKQSLFHAYRTQLEASIPVKQSSGGTKGGPCVVSCSVLQATLRTHSPTRRFLLGFGILVSLSARDIPFENSKI
jgi:hypothetical protein